MKYRKDYLHFKKIITQQKVLNVEEKSCESGPESKFTKMQKTFDSFFMVPKTNTPNNLEKDFKIVEGTDQKNKQLVNLYQNILTFQPTSANSERVFSISRNFIIKIRNRLNKETLNALVFLKFYFQ